MVRAQSTRKKVRGHDIREQSDQPYNGEKFGIHSKEVGGPVEDFVLSKS